MGIMLVGLLVYVVYIAILYESHKKKYRYYKHQDTAMRLLFKQIRREIRKRVNNDSK